LEGQDDESVTLSSDDAASGNIDSAVGAMENGGQVSPDCQLTTNPFKVVTFNKTQDLERDAQHYVAGQALAVREDVQIIRTIKTKIFKHMKYIQSESELSNTSAGTLGAVIMDDLHIEEHLRAGFWSVAKNLVYKQIAEERQQVNTKLKKAWFSKLLGDLLLVPVEQILHFVYYPFFN
jgi:hypothetical protein